MKSDWLQFEHAVAAFCSALAPDAHVTHNAITPDIHTDRPRQRDVWIEASIGGFFPIKLLVSCKRYTRKFNAQQMDAFVGELEGSGAHKGVVYSYSGFTGPALEKARKKGITCCVLLENQPPPIPEALLFDAYLFREVPQLVAEGGEGPRDWPALLRSEIELEGQIILARKILADRFAEDLPELQRAIGSGRIPCRQVSVEISVDVAGGPVTLSLRSDWRIFRARVEAWLVNGSYSFTDNNFHGNLSTPSIDMWSSHPGPGWEPIAIDDIGAGNTVKMFMTAGDVSTMLETPLFETATIVQ